MLEVIYALTKHASKVQTLCLVTRPEISNQTDLRSSGLSAIFASDLIANHDERCSPPPSRRRL